MIHIENLVKRYGSITALNHLNLDIREGEIFGLLVEWFWQNHCNQLYAFPVKIRQGQHPYL